MEIVLFFPTEGHESEHLPVNIGLTCGGELGADVRCHRHDVGHEGIHIGEDGVVNPLEHIVRGIPLGGNKIGIVNKSVAVRLDVHGPAIYIEVAYHFIQKFFHDTTGFSGKDIK